MDTLRNSGPVISLASAMQTVMDEVRSEASRLRAVQTPVLYGYIEGGLTLPGLVAGAQFARLFPGTKGHKINGSISELEAFGIPQALIAAWESEIGPALNALQLEAVNDFRILDGESVFVVAPTSSGKTFVGEIAAARAISEGRKAVFLLPYKALANEKFDQFTRSFGEKCGMRVIRCTGDFQDQTSAFFQGKFDLALLTYEMFLNLSLGKPYALTQIGLVVVDEAQFISDPNRGIVVELLLTHLLSHAGKEVSPQLLTLSAVVGGLNNFPEWLKSKPLIRTDRPVPLAEGVLDETGLFRFKAPDGEVKSEQLIPRGAIVQRGEKKSSQDVIVPFVKSLLAGNPGEKIIVFRNRRGPAEGCANYLSEALSLPCAEEPLSSLPSHDQSRASAKLRNCLQGGTAFHDSNLTREEREIVERAFRRKDSSVKVLAATTTVAAGINTPASTVIIAETEFVGSNKRPFMVSEYKNMAGRAGRLGYQEAGKSIILSSSPSQTGLLFNKYVMGEPEPIRSSFDPDKMDTWVIRLLAQVKSAPRKEVAQILSATYGGYLANRQNPGWVERIAPDLENLVSEMIHLGLVEQEGEMISLTLLGTACGRSSLSLPSAMRLVKMFRERAGTPVSGEEIMVLLQCLKEMDNGPNPVMKKGMWESRWPQALERIYGRRTVSALQYQAQEQYVFFGRCKRGMILKSWLDGKPMEEIEREFSPNPYTGNVSAGDVRALADLTKFHLRSAFEIGTILMLIDSASIDGFDTLILRLELGIPESLMELAECKVTLTRGEMMAFEQSGINNLEMIRQESPDRIIAILGKAKGLEMVVWYQPTWEKVPGA
jgi:helicase